jgi:hypothetical protein
MAINYKQVEDLINIQYKDTKLADGSLSLNSLYYDYFRQANFSNMTNMLSDNFLVNGILKMLLGIKSKDDKEQDELDMKNLLKKYPVVYDKVKYKYYGK